MKSLRLSLLLAILAAAIIYAVATDHPAPAWGATRLPGLFGEVLVCLLFAVGAWSLWRAHWPRGSPCARPQTLIAGKAGAKFMLEVARLNGHVHLPIVRLQRAA